MAGEQQRRADRVDGPVEIGVVLVDALAEIRVLMGAQRAPVLAQVDGVRGDLDAILNKAMKKSPADRYGTVDAFAGDLQRYLAGEPVLARPDRAVYRLKKFAGRHRVAFAATTAVLAALLVATAVSVFQAQEAKRQAEIDRNHQKALDEAAAKAKEAEARYQALASKSQK